MYPKQKHALEATGPHRYVNDWTFVIREGDAAGKRAIVQCFKDRDFGTDWGHWPNMPWFETYREVWVALVGNLPRAEWHDKAAALAAETLGIQGLVRRTGGERCCTHGYFRSQNGDKDIVRCDVCSAYEDDFHAKAEWQKDGEPEC